MLGHLECVVIDCPDPHRLARFYQALLGGEVDRPDRRFGLGPGWSTLHFGDGAVIAFQAVTDYRPPAWPDPERPQQVHLDIRVDDPAAAEERVLALDGTILDRGADGRGWRVYADPAGHPFCLVG